MGANKEAMGVESQMRFEEPVRVVGGGDQRSTRVVCSGVSLLDACRGSAEHSASRVQTDSDNFVYSGLSVWVCQCTQGRKPLIFRRAPSALGRCTILGGKLLVYRSHMAEGRGLLMRGISEVQVQTFMHMPLVYKAVREVCAASGESTESTLAVHLDPTQTSHRKQLLGGCSPNLIRCKWLGGGGCHTKPDVRSLRWRDLSGRRYAVMPGHRLAR